MRWGSGSGGDAKCAVLHLHPDRLQTRPFHRRIRARTRRKWIKKGSGQDGETYRVVGCVVSVDGAAFTCATRDASSGGAILLHRPRATQRVSIRFQVPDVLLEPSEKVFPSSSMTRDHAVATSGNSVGRRQLTDCRVTAPFARESCIPSATKFPTDKRKDLRLFDAKTLTLLLRRHRVQRRGGSRLDGGCPISWEGRCSG